MCVCVLCVYAYVCRRVVRERVSRMNTQIAVTSLHRGELAGVCVLCVYACVVRERESVCVNIVCFVDSTQQCRCVCMYGERKQVILHTSFARSCIHKEKARQRFPRKKKYI